MQSEPGEEFFGPWEGHLVGCEYDTRALVRMSLQRIADEVQGAVYPMVPPDIVESGLLGPICCHVDAPSGTVWIGSLRESGWGAGSNVGEVVRMTVDADRLPAGIAEMRLVEHGFEVEFTRPVDPSLARDVASYQLVSYTRVSTPRYGGEDQGLRHESIERAELLSDQKTVQLLLPELRTGFVYHLNVRPFTGAGEFFPREAFYTLNYLAQ